MSKKKWVLVILIVIVVGYLVLNKIYPPAGEAIDNLLGPTVSGFVNGLYVGITTHPIWVSNWGWIGLIAGGILGGLLVYRGRDTYDSLRGIARVRATEKPMAWSTAPPSSTPVPITQTTPTPIKITPTQIEQPQEQEQKS